MLRSDLLFLRRMARREQHQDLTLYDDLSLAGGWWGLAQQAAGPAKEGILTMALKHYSGASRSDLGPAVDPLIQDRIRQALAVLPQRNYLFFKPEVSVEGVEHPEKLRTYHIKVDGTPSPFGLSAEPPAKGSSRVIFRLDIPYKRFEGGVGINDVAGESKTPLVFRILGDGKELWKSSPLKRPSERVNFDVDVAGVRELTLVVDCPGENIGALASWLEPRLSE